MRRFLSISLVFLFALSVEAQVRPVYDRGAVGLMQLLKRLNTTASVLMIGAHPDDEDTALLTYLARGENARTAYLSLTRGDGGQNIIGPELGEALGVIRTEELLQARRLDGAEQFFTRAYDFGFSKTLDEARAKWDEKIILCDAVRVIRNFRPLVVVSQFSGTPADGHGQHQFAGYISPLAVKAAADPAQCTDAGGAWQVKKFYVRHRGQGEPTLRINTGKYDTLLGRSYFEIAMEARSQHKSQEQGVLELRGEQFSALKLAGSDVKESGMFDGLDTSLMAMPKTYQRLASKSRTTFVSMSDAASKSLRDYDPRDPTKILPTLIETYKLLDLLLDYDPGVEVSQSGEEVLLIDRHVDYVLSAKRELAKNAIKEVAGLQIDALSDSETVVPGESIFVSAKAFTPLKDLVKIKNLRLIAPESWTVAAAEVPKNNTPAFVTRENAGASAYFSVTVPRVWQPTQPYWLGEPREGDLFRWTCDPASHTLPFQNAALRLAATIDVNGTEIEIERPVEFRYADDIRGEVRRNLNIVPPVSVEMSQPLLIVPHASKPQTHKITMSVTSNSVNEKTGNVKLTSNGWNVSPSASAFELKKSGEKFTTSFDVTIPSGTKPGSYSIFGVANVLNLFTSSATQPFLSTVKTIAYPHIQTHRFYRLATTDVKVIELKTSPVRIGYITGSGDRVADAIRQMGFNVETISESELASGNLSKYDTIVVGIRAFQVRPDVVANNQRLLDYARNGGTLIVQYQLPAYAPLAPFATQMGPRVVDENATVNIVDPKHPIFNFPNKITAADFDGWVQERNLYNFTNFGAEYAGLLESHDAGEAENKGGLVIAKVGKGNYVYCSYSMFRQLPAGVPGAYRLFANLVSLPKSQNRLR